MIQFDKHDEHIFQLGWGEKKKSTLPSHDGLELMMMVTWPSNNVSIKVITVVLTIIVPLIAGGCHRWFQSSGL